MANSINGAAGILPIHGEEDFNWQVRLCRAVRVGTQGMGDARRLWRGGGVAEPDGRGWRRGGGRCKRGAPAQTQALALAVGAVALRWRQRSGKSSNTC